MSNLKKIDLTNITISSTYAGEGATPFISALLFQGKTLANNWVNIMPNIRYKAVVQKVDTGNLIQAYAEAFNASGTITKAETVITLTDLMVNVSWPKKQLVSDWASQYFVGDATHETSNDFNSYVLDYIPRKASEQIEYNLWRGNMTGSSATISGYTLFDGLLRKIDQAVPNRFTVTAITKGNVIANLDAAYNTCLSNCSQILDQSPCFYVSNKTGGLFSQAQQVTDSRYTTEAGVMKYLGYEVRVVPGMCDDMIVFTVPDNLRFGTLLVDDFNSVTVKDMLESNLDLSIRCRMDFKCATACIYGAEVVFGK